MVLALALADYIHVTKQVVLLRSGAVARCSLASAADPRLPSRPRPRRLLPRIFPSPADFRVAWRRADAKGERQKANACLLACLLALLPRRGE